MLALPGQPVLRPVILRIFISVLPAATAVITDVHYRMSLALIRDLAQAQVRVVCCEREGTPAPLGFVSKYAGEAVPLPEQGWPEALLDLCAELYKREGRRPALLPVGAATLAVLAQSRAHFDPVCGLCIPTPEQLDAFNSKQAAARLAERLGIPVPRHFVPEAGQPIGLFFARLPMPCVVKPLCGEKFGLSAARRYVIARTPQQGEQAFARFQALTGAPPIVQEYLPGGGLGCSVLAREGRVYASLCHRRVREYPVSGGPSSCCVRVDRPDLEEFAARMVQKTGYTGLAMFEFKEGEDGQPRLLEVNPRVWGTFPLTRAAKSGLPLLWCTLSWNRGNPEQDPRPLPPPPPFRPCKMQFGASDLMSAAGYLKGGKPGRALGALADLLNPAVRDGVWEWGDPRPGLMYCRSLLKKEKP